MLQWSCDQTYAFKQIAAITEPQQHVTSVYAIETTQKLSCFNQFINFIRLCKQLHSFECYYFFRNYTYTDDLIVQSFNLYTFIFQPETPLKRSKNVEECKSPISRLIELEVALYLEEQGRVGVSNFRSQLKNRRRQQPTLTRR